MRLIDFAFRNTINKDAIVMLQVNNMCVIADKWKYFADSDYLHAEVKLITEVEPNKILITLERKRND